MSAQPDSRSSADAVVNAEMGPAVGIRGSGGLVAADALAAAADVEPDREPSAGWLVVQSNGVAQGIGEGALTVGLGEAGEGGATVGGDRCAGDVDRVGKARLVSRCRRRQSRWGYLGFARRMSPTG